MTLDGLEQTLMEAFPQARHAGLKMNMVRYADDFIITGYSREWLEEKVKPIVVNFLAERGLALSVEKTQITHITEGFDFLGWNIRKYKGKLLIKPSKASIQALLKKVKKIIKDNKAITQVQLIRLMNPVIRGWATYHKHTVAKKIFAFLDAQIWSMLWRWATRRHPNKGAQWVKTKYFRTQGNQHWVFAAEDEKQAGKVITRFLASSVPIKRHIKIKADANPYDKRWNKYFATRWARQWTTSHESQWCSWVSQDALAVA